MEPSPIKQGCLSAVMLRVSGPDPKGRKMRQHAFFHSRNGSTTLSASGICLPAAHPSDQLPDSSTQVLVLTDASLIEPFIRQPHSAFGQWTPSKEPSPFGPSTRAVPIRSAVTKGESQEPGDGGKGLLHGTKIMALFDEETGVEGWHAGELLDMVDVPSATEALSSLLSAHSSIDSGGWQLGWHLVSVDKASPSHGAVSHKIRSRATSAGRISAQLHGTQLPVSSARQSELFGVGDLPRNETRAGEGFFRALPTGHKAAETPQGIDGLDEGEVVNGVVSTPQDSGSEPELPRRRSGFEAVTDGSENASSWVRVAVLRVTVKGARGSVHRGDPQGGTTPSGGVSTEAPLGAGRTERGEIKPESRHSTSDGAEQSPASRAPYPDFVSVNSGQHRAGLVSAGPLRRADFLTAVGSPFGALSPRHFSNSVSVGVVSNWWPGENRAPILLADMRCLPGMEGGPVLDRAGGVVGMLWRPIRQRKSGAEVQLVITADALAPALHPFGVDLLSRAPCHMAHSGACHVVPPRPFQAAATATVPLQRPPMADVLSREDFSGAQRLLSTEPPTSSGNLSELVLELGSKHRASQISDGQDTLFLQPTASSSAAPPVSTFQSAPFRDASRRNLHPPEPFTDIVSNALIPHAKDPSAARGRPTTPPLLLAAFHTPTDFTTAGNMGGIHTSVSVTDAVQRAAASVVMVLVDDGAWGSGVVLSASGLILTNAHLIEPWRFMAKPKVQASKPQPLARMSGPLVQTSGAEENERENRFATADGGAGPSGEPCISEKGFGKSEDVGHVEARETCDGTLQSLGNMTERSRDHVDSLAEPMGGSGRLQDKTDLGSGAASEAAVNRSKVGYWEWINGSAATCQDQGAPRGRLEMQQARGTESRSDTVAESRPVEDQSSPLPPPGLRRENALVEGSHPAEDLKSPESANHKLRAHRAIIPRQTASNPPQKYRPVRVRLSDRKGATWQSARVVFVAQGPFDAALLQVLDAPTGLQPIVPTPYDASPGDTAIVIGHGLFGPMTDLRPSVYSGVVSRVVKSRGRPAMLQTTAAVHPGGSGGAVIDARGRLIGLVTSAARHSGGSMLPHLNFSIPAKALQPLFDFAGSGGLNVGLLDPLNTVDSHLSAIWALAPPPPLPWPPSLRPGHVPETLPGQEDASPGSVKGTKFAQFLADRGQGLTQKGLLQCKL